MDNNYSEESSVSQVQDNKLAKSLYTVYSNRVKPIEGGKYVDKINFTFSWQDFDKVAEDDREKALEIFRYNCKVVIEGLADMFRGTTSSASHKEHWLKMTSVFFDERNFDTLHFRFHHSNESLSEVRPPIDFWFDYEPDNQSNIVNVHIRSIVERDNKAIRALEKRDIAGQFAHFVQNPLEPEQALATLEWEYQDSVAPSDFTTAPPPQVGEEEIERRLNSRLMLERRMEIEHEINNKYVQELKNNLVAVHGIKDREVHLGFDWRSIAALPGHDPIGKRNPIWRGMLKQTHPTRVLKHVRDLFLDRSSNLWAETNTVNWFLERYECDFVVSFEYMQHDDLNNLKNKAECTVTERDIDGSEKKGFRYHIRQTFHNLDSPMLVHSEKNFYHEFFGLIDPLTKKQNLPGLWLWHRWEKDVLNSSSKYVQKVSDYFADGANGRPFPVEVDWDSIYETLPIDGSIPNVEISGGLCTPRRVLAVDFLGNMVKAIHHALCGLQNGDTNAVAGTPETKNRFLDEFDKLVMRCAGFKAEGARNYSAERGAECPKTLILNIEGKWTDDLTLDHKTISKLINDLFSKEGKGDMKWEEKVIKAATEKFNTAANLLGSDGDALKDKFRIRFDWTFLKDLLDEEERKAALKVLEAALNAVVNALTEMMKVVEPGLGDANAAKHQQDLNAEVFKFFDRYDSICFTIMRGDSREKPSNLELSLDLDYMNEMRVVFEHAVIAKSSKVDIEKTPETITRIRSFLHRAPVKFGKMTKEGHRIKNWKLRDFVLYADGTLSYYGKGSMHALSEFVDSLVATGGQPSTQQQKAQNKKPKRGTINLAGAEVFSEEKKKRPFCFSVVDKKKNKTYPICASSEEEKTAWMEAIRRIIALSEAQE